MTQSEIITLFCRLQRTVQEKVYNFSVAADCFCRPESQSMTLTYQNNLKCFNFIQEAVFERIRKFEKLEEPMEE